MLVSPTVRAAKPSAADPLPTPPAENCGQTGVRVIARESVTHRTRPVAIPTLALRPTGSLSAETQWSCRDAVPAVPGTTDGMSAESDTIRQAGCEVLEQSVRLQEIRVRPSPSPHDTTMSAVTRLPQPTTPHSVRCSVPVHFHATARNSGQSGGSWAIDPRYTTAEIQSA